MRSKIYLAFASDWEIRGNGSGNPRKLQFESLRRQTAIFDRYGIKGSFNAEIMQQLYFRRYQDSYPELKETAEEWESVVLDAFARGHDFQVHFHPQWQGATYLGDWRWNLPGDWSVLNYPPDDVRQMILQGMNYLQSLLRRVDTTYHCSSFRAGSWCVAPSPFMLPLLHELGFVFDMSIVSGLVFDTDKVRLDYSRCEEGFLPYYPQMDDARRMSNHAEPIVCVPTNHFRPSVVSRLNRDLRLLIKLGMRKGHTTSSSQGVTGDEWVNQNAKGIFGKIMAIAKRYKPGLKAVADLSHMDYPQMKEMLAQIRSRALHSGLPSVPVILVNHGKDIDDISAIERLVAEVASADDIECVTLTQLAVGFRENKFVVRCAAAACAPHNNGIGIEDTT